MAKPPTSGATGSLAEFADKEAQARYAENADLARAARVARAEAAEGRQQITELKKRLELFEALDRTATSPPTWIAPPSPKTHHAIPTLVVSDIHYGDRIEPTEVEGYNAYNVEIANGRLQRGFTSAVKLVRNYIGGVEHDGFHVMLPGDCLSGTIHEELVETNVLTLAESILAVCEPLEAGLTLLAKEFKQVHVTAVVGNHSRRTKKPRGKRRVKDNFDWLVYQMMAKHFRDRGVKNITINAPPSADAPVSIYNTKYRLTHGDQFRGGSGIAAELSPLLLGVHRKVKRQAALNNPFDVMVMGHFHKSLWLPQSGLIVCGPVIGYSEHDYVSNYTPAPPQCELWLTTPERGITVHMPVYVQDRPAEGW